MVLSVLEEMRIRSLGVIDDAVVELSPGFTAVTGEFSISARRAPLRTSLGVKGSQVQILSSRRQDRAVS